MVWSKQHQSSRVNILLPSLLSPLSSVINYFLYGILPNVMAGHDVCLTQANVEFCTELLNLGRLDVFLHFFYN